MKPPTPKTILTMIAYHARHKAAETTANTTVVIPLLLLLLLIWLLS